MKIRWVTKNLGTSPWLDVYLKSEFSIVDVRALRDAEGNSPCLIQSKINEATQYLEKGEKVIICCDFGISRSNVIAAAVLARTSGCKLDQGLEEVINATGENGIKINFVNDVRKAIGENRSSFSNGSGLIIGVDTFIGKSLCRVINPDQFKLITISNKILQENQVILDINLDLYKSSQVLFCWHPVALDTSKAAGQLITALRNVLEVCRIRNLRLIFLSGQQVFSGKKEVNQEFFCEHDKPLPKGAAGEALFLAETLVNHYSNLYNISTLIIRHSYVYGPGDNRPWVLNTFIKKILANHDLLVHSYENGEPILDLIHINDFTKEVNLAAMSGLEGVIHLTSGNSITTKALAEKLIFLSNSISKVRCASMPGYSNIVRLRSIFKNEASGCKSFVSLDKGLLELIASNLN